MAGKSNKKIQLNIIWDNFDPDRIAGLVVYSFPFV